jgi:hypothetical protein
MVAVAASDRRMILSLELALGVQGRKRDRIQGEAAPAAPGLGCRVVDLVVDDHPGNGGGDGGVVEVDVDPAQPSQLAAAHAGGGDQQPQRIQAVVADMVEECAQFLG